MANRRERGRGSLAIFDIAQRHGGLVVGGVMLGPDLLVCVFIVERVQIVTVVVVKRVPVLEAPTSTSRRRETETTAAIEMPLADVGDIVTRIP